MPKKSPLLPIFLIVLVDVFGLTLVIPLLPRYAEEFGATPLEATLLYSTFAVCQLFSGPVLGRISDRVGRKPMLALSQVGTLVGFLIMARAGSLWVLYLGRTIDGATAGNLSLAQAYISDNTEREDRAKSFAIIGIAFGVGFFVGPAMAAYLTRYGLAAPFYAAAALSLLSVVCTLTLLPGGRPPTAEPGGEVGPAGRRVSVFAWRSYADFLTRPVLGGVLVQFAFFQLAFSTFTSGFALFAERTFVVGGHPFGPREVGYIFAYAGFLGIVLQGGLIGRLVKRFGERSLASAGFVCLAVGYVGLGFVHDLGPLVAVSTVSTVGIGLLRPVLTSLITQAAGRDEQGAVLGVNQSLTSFVQALAPLAVGVLMNERLLTVWALFAGLAALGGLVAARWGSGRAAPLGRA